MLHSKFILMLCHGAPASEEPFPNTQSVQSLMSFDQIGAIWLACCRAEIPRLSNRLSRDSREFADQSSNDSWGQLV